jgi:hypothetical protein
MAEGAPIKRRLGGFGSGVSLVVAWAVAILVAKQWHGYGMLFQRMHDFVDVALYRVFSGFPEAQQVAHRVFESLEVFTAGTYALTLAVATFAVPLAFVIRMIARARARAGHSDPLDRIRGWLASPLRRTALVAAFPIVSQAALLYGVWRPDWNPAYRAVMALVAGLAQLVVARAAWRAFLAPTIAARDGDEAPLDIGTDEIRFNAVAVTRETKAAVGALAAVTMGVVGWMVSLPTLALFKDPRVFTVVPVYVLLAAASALLFRGASRISVGVDGIYVGGTSRARFFAYRELDEARVKAGDIELVRGGRVVLRLQLHGADAARRDAIVARIHQALARVKDVERDAAANFVTSRSTDKVAQSARGGGDYRMPSVSHDALWSLVEGSAVAALTRTAAAEALVSTGGVPERDRLRVAAAHCADPQVRLALEELADDADDYGEPQTSTSRSPARM